MNHKPVRIGFVGVGTMGQCAHLRNYATLRDCEIVALSELRPKLARSVAKRWNIPASYESLQEMLQKESFDGLVCSQPFNRHGQVLPELLETGLPIFIEKPLAHSTEIAEKILQDLQASSSFIMVGYHKRSDPAVIWAKQRLSELQESQEIGNLRHVRIEIPEGNWISGGFFDLLNSKEPRPELDCDPPSTQMSDARFKEYSAFVNFYIHHVNLMRHFMGDYQVRYADPTGVLLVGESQDKIPCTIEMSAFTSPSDWQESVTLAFERGWMKIELPAPLVINQPGRVTLFRDPGLGQTPMTESPTLPPIHAMRQQAIHFIQAIRGERTPPCDAAEAAKDLDSALEYMQCKERNSQ